MNYNEENQYPELILACEEFSCEDFEKLSDVFKSLASDFFWPMMAERSRNVVEQAIWM